MSVDPGGVSIIDEKGPDQTATQKFRLSFTVHDHRPVSNVVVVETRE